MISLKRCLYYENRGMNIFPYHYCHKRQNYIDSFIHEIYCEGYEYKYHDCPIYKASIFSVNSFF